MITVFNAKGWYWLVLAVYGLPGPVNVQKRDPVDLLKNFLNANPDVAALLTGGKS